MRVTNIQNDENLKHSTNNIEKGPPLWDLFLMENANFLNSSGKLLAELFAMSNIYVGCAWHVRLV